MSEQELRRLAGIARAILHLLLDDPGEMQRVGAQIDAALAMPPGGTSMLALLDALTSDPVLRGWLAEQRGEGLYRADAPVRHLAADLPDRISAGVAFGVLVQVTAARRRLSAPMANLSVGRDGVIVTVLIKTDWTAFEALGSDLRQELLVPPEGDSDMIEFGLRALRPGPHEISVHAFAGGTPLGGVTAIMRVTDGGGTERGEPRRHGLSMTTRRAGEATLVVQRDAQHRYLVHLETDAGGAPAVTDRIAGDPRHAVDGLVAELDRLAAGKVSVGERLHRLQNLGVDLWTRAVPAAVREQFWQVAGGIRALHIFGDDDGLPWELSYPLSKGDDRGYLVDLFPVVRHAGAESHRTRLALRSAVFVAPSSGRPANTDAEIKRVRNALGPTVPYRGTVASMADLRAMLDAPPGVLHFVCHHRYSGDGGPVLQFGKDWFTPVDLAIAEHREALKSAAPLVFFNACRTAARIPGLTGHTGWAQRFMAAGAGVFLGTLWPVESKAAMRFAGAFYDAFVGDRQPLGDAVTAARTRVCDDGDPTRLAYTVYGDPDAVAVPGGIDA